MSGNWFTKRFTFMVIADANSNVVRFRISGILLYIAPLIVLLLAAAALYLYVIHERSASLSGRLASELSGQSTRYQATIATKDQTIEQLQNELIHLSEQAEEIKTKVEEFKKFESEMKSIAGTDGKGGSDAAQAANGQAAASGGVGGKDAPVSDEDVADLVNQTKTSYTSIGNEITELFGSLTETKQKVLETQHLLRVTPTLWPADSHQITSGFGMRIDPFTKAPSFHSGIDFGANTGDPAYVTADGVVASTGSDATHGNNIVVTHENGLSTWYMHLSKIKVKAGDTVTKGQVIGLVGSTGRSTGPHLHYEVLKNGKSIDPKPYLKTVRKEE